MTQRACVFLQTQNDLNLFAKNLEDFKELAKQFHLCIFILEKNDVTFDMFLQNLTYDSVLQIYEVIPTDLTYEGGADGAVTPVEIPVVRDTLQKLWVNDIDAWFGLPKVVETKLQLFGPHIYFFDHTSEVHNL